MRGTVLTHTVALHTIADTRWMIRLVWTPFVSDSHMTCREIRNSGFFISESWPVIRWIVTPECPQCRLCSLRADADSSINTGFSPSSASNFNHTSCLPGSIENKGGVIERHVRPVTETERLVQNHRYKIPIYSPPRPKHRTQAIHTDSLRFPTLGSDRGRDTAPENGADGKTIQLACYQRPATENRCPAVVNCIPTVTCSAAKPISHVHAQLGRLTTLHTTRLLSSEGSHHWTTVHAAR